MLELIEELLVESTPLPTQIAIIEQLNKHMLDANVLYQLATYLLSQGHLIDGFPKEAVDIVGTGGDGHDTLNFSTMSAIVTAACGYKVAKHGNKSTTSKCGSFDLLMRMGVSIPDTPAGAVQNIDQQGISFLFAPYFHPVMKNVAAARKEFAKRGEKTIFNLMGPLLNPGRTSRMSVGVYRKDLLEPYAQVLSRLGVEYGIVAYGDSMDELSVCGPSDVALINQGQIEMLEWIPEEYSYDRAEIALLAGGDAEQNWQETHTLLSGKLPGPKTDMVTYNAGAAMMVASGFEFDMQEGINKAQYAIMSGDVQKFLQEIGACN